MKTSDTKIISLSTLGKLSSDAITLLKQLIATPSLSKEENETADILELFLQQKNIKTSLPIKTKSNFV